MPDRKIKFSPFLATFESKNLSDFDASFSTEYIYRASIDGLQLALHKEKLPAPFYKSYDVQDIIDSIVDAETIVAESEGQILGFASVRLENWNNRAVLAGLYVAPRHKGRGIGKALITSAEKHARSLGARCLWLETQNFNYPAIGFYLRMGFELCGFDRSLYDPADIPDGEIALYFEKKIGRAGPKNKAEITCR